MAASRSKAHGQPRSVSYASVRWPSLALFFHSAQGEGYLAASTPLVTKYVSPLPNRVTKNNMFISFAECHHEYKGEMVPLRLQRTTLAKEEPGIRRTECMLALSMLHEF